MSPGKTLLFLGDGRCRFAELLFNAVVARMGLRWQASSRRLEGEATAGGVVEALRALGVRDAEAGSRAPAPLTPADVQEASVIVALMAEEQHPQIRERFPELADKIEFWPVDDTPETFHMLEGKVMDLVARLLGGGGVAPSPPREEPKKPPPKPVTLKVGRETSGRRGKGVTTVFDTPLDEDALRELAGKLKQRCGTGGTVKDGRIEIQGDQRERIIQELEALGFKVKRVGG